MSVNLSELQEGKIVVIEATGKLTKQDYEQFVPKVEQHIKTFGKIRILFEMKDFHGWEGAALWQDLKFDIKHFRHIERLAMVGEKRWEKGMSVFCKPFTTAKIRYFDASDTDKAYEWIRDEQSSQ
ncbi:MAG: STAS/SEC14 domain-containing protein [Phycisphaerae bacterium]|nr:STAS/SEC14 domain-containing protein [Phycisphaerae bacterium]